MSLLRADRPADAAGRGAQPSLVENFIIEGLHGYRTLGLSSEFAATILIARNGAGKTTLLAVLDAFLRGQLGRLRDLKFNQIKCKLRGLPELVLTIDDLARFLTPSSQLSSEALRLKLDPLQLLNFVTDQFESTDLRTLPLDHEVLGPIVRRMEYNWQKTKDLCEHIRTLQCDGSAALLEIFAALSSALKETEIVYLPTYRRVELPFTGPQSVDPRGRRRSAFKMTQTGLHGGDIQFGLGDISERLSDLNTNILAESSYGYRRISASIINELIDGEFDRSTPSTEDIPSSDELKLFFSRIKEGPRRTFLDDVAIPNLERAYTQEGMSPDTNKFLVYFLSKLNTVLSSTRNIETDVENFVESCNRYLTFEDESTSIETSSTVERSEDKELVLDRNNLEVHVESIDGRKITLDALSSGEKQMVSLFAKLFLYQQEKILLIDEPELSLSIDWQKQILVDAINAPRCKQIIAITHSPFIFDNALEPFARALHSSIDDQPQQTLFDNDDQP